MNIVTALIAADNGREFAGETTAWMKQSDITYIHTLSYSPESAELVEETNEKVRKVLKEIMILTNSRN
jgi:hypothetical protein